MVLGFWMGKDSKDHPLGERGSTGGPGFAESGGRNWLHSAATVLGFLQKERQLLKPGYRFQPITRDAVLRDFDVKKQTQSVQKIVPIPTTNVITVPSDPEKIRTNGHTETSPKFGTLQPG
jgi:hypothetical protein